ncbi:TonB-dependent siderophore receptor [Arcobacter sp. FW59]|nr:TonB-dependent siderophore receptor [Arcobacter sp. FW59]
MKMEKKIIFISLFVSSLIFANETTKLEEITVSANKMEENIKDVPQSISVISEEEIEQKGIKTVQDIIKEIPNMSINPMVGNGVSFRGLNGTVFGNTNPVIIYVDGVPYYDMLDFNPSLADVEQVEVLRGPQGTLYGKNANGAVINIVTKAPTNKWKAKIGTEFGNQNYSYTTLNTSGAIIDDKLYAGINGSYMHDDGWIKNNYSGMNKNANRKEDRETSAYLMFKPTDNFSGKLTISDNYERRNFIDGFAAPTGVRINSLDRDNEKNVSFDMPTLEKIKVKSQALNLSYELEKVKFESVTTHKQSIYDSIFDTDYLAYNANDGSKQWNYTDSDIWAQELKISSKNQDIKWVTGLYFEKEEKDMPKGGYAFAAGSDNFVSKRNGETYAIFGQTMIPLGNSFELTLGGRLQKIKKDIDLMKYSNWGGFESNMPYKDEKTWNSFLPKVALTYKINDNLTTYASISKGYMPGGHNYFPNTPNSSPNTFEPEKNISYEIGAKYIGDNFALNTAIFYMNIEDFQVYTQGISGYDTSNAKKAHSQGIELDGTYFITDNWSISGSLGLIQSKYDDYFDGVNKYDGEKIENTPNYTANLGISYLANSGIYGRLDLNARGSTNYFVITQGEFQKADGGITANAKIGYKIGDFDIYAFGKNITNEDYITSVYSNIITFNEPRRFGIGAIYKF